MNSKVKIFVRNISYTIVSNFISLLISILVVLIVPKLIGVFEYGYWQLYLFYSSYVGFLHFGWISGIYLKLGGEKYSEIDKKSIAAQFYLFFIFQILIALFIIISVKIFTDNPNKAFILYMVSLYVIIANVGDFISFIFLATSRFEEYSKSISLGRIIYLILIVCFLSVGNREFRVMIIADLLGRLISLLYTVYKARDIVLTQPQFLNDNLKDALSNISIGCRLMLANVASMSIIGVVKYGVERAWDIETFGKISLTLSVSNLLMTFINAVGIIVFPILRRSKEEKISDIYSIIRDSLMVVLLFLLIGYYPLKMILSIWLPQYSKSLIYMAILFPVLLYEGKMALLINSYYKTLRKEKLMLSINALSFILSVFFTIITTVLLRNLNLTILSILILLTSRSIMAEIILSNILNISVKKDIYLESTLTLVFILSGWFVNSWMTTIIYGVSYILYLLIKKNELRKTINNLKLLI